MLYIVKLSMCSKSRSFIDDRPFKDNNRKSTRKKHDNI